MHKPNTLTVTGKFSTDTDRKDQKKNYSTKKETRQAKLETMNRKQVRKIKYATV